MKILHINTSDSGGAAKAVMRLQEGLLGQHLDSEMLTLFKENQQYKHATHFLDQNRSLWKRAEYSLKYRINNYQKQLALKNKPKNYEVFSFSKTIYDLTKHPLVQQADIIHLHWIGNFVNFPSFFKKIQKPLVWTLHDMNPFSGGFHYDQDLCSNKKVWEKLDHKIRFTKKKALAGIDNLSVICPSKWLYQCSAGSDLLRKFQHHHIPHGIDPYIFKPFHQQVCRRILNLPEDKKIILFVADDLHNQRKGLKYLQKALKLLKNKSNHYLLCTLGKGEVVADGIETCNIGYVYHEYLLAVIYAASDVLITPTLGEAFGYTVLESLACGTPVVGFDVGGIPDMVRPNETGLLAKYKDEKDLAVKMEYILEDDEFRMLLGKNARRVVENEYTLELQARRYKELYHKILNNEQISAHTFNKDLTEVWGKSR